MNLPLPENHAVKKAVQWISSEMKANPSLKRSELIHKASLRFNLSPAETENLFGATKEANVKN
ncbi:MAG: hypothetical protein CSA18_03765 [Deltaproteobacteria bacterium]|nr:MAG: hypothetical protein CSA18_03765 [Deltaproteobacteria bacterium]